MTVQNPAWALAAEDQTPASWRRMLQFQSGSRPGVVAGLAVTQRASTPNMSVNVADGAAIVAGTEATTSQGYYFCENQGVQNVTVTPAHPTLQRRDLVVARVRDAQYSGATNAWALEVVAGAAASTPLFPAVPANSLVLAAILVPAAVDVITNAAITDLRSGSLSDGSTTLINRGYAAALGGRILCTSGTRPLTAVDGWEIYETDTDRIYNGDGTDWVLTSMLGAGLTWATTITQGVAVAHTTNRASVTKMGRRVMGEMHLTCSGSGTASNLITVGLPYARAVAVAHAIGSGYVLDASTGNYHPVIMFAGATQTASFVMASATATQFLGQLGLTQLASGDIISATFQYETTS